MRGSSTELLDGKKRFKKIIYNMEPLIACSEMMAAAAAELPSLNCSHSRNNTEHE